MSVYALAQRAAKRVLDDDSRKAALNSAEDNVKAAHGALRHARLPSALGFALKAAEKRHADGLPMVGEIILSLGHATPAMAAFEKSDASGLCMGLRSSIGRASALAALHRPAAEVSAACERAHDLCTTPAKQRLELARLQSVGGMPDGIQPDRRNRS